MYVRLQSQPIWRCGSHDALLHDCFGGRPDTSRHRLQPRLFFQAFVHAEQNHSSKLVIRLTLCRWTPADKTVGNHSFATAARLATATPRLRPPFANGRQWKTQSYHQVSRLVRYSSFKAATFRPLTLTSRLHVTC